MLPMFILQASAIALIMTSRIPEVTSSLEKVENYHVQVRVYVDGPAFAFWKGLSGKDAFHDYATEIRSYFAEVQKTYDSLQEFHTIAITFEVENITLTTKNALQDPYIRSQMIPGLEAFRNSIYWEWLDDPYDMAILFTGYTLGGTNVGYARIGTACTLDAVGVLQQKDTETVVLGLAHEIGHILGAQHDADQYEDLDCYVANGKVMNPAMHKYKQTKYSFSSCSNADFENKLGILKNNCLKDGTGSVTSTRLGALISPDEYCKRNKFGGQFVLRNSALQYGQSHICKTISCVEVDGKNAHIMVTLQGMMCGKNKVCNRGECEISFDDGSPFVSDACPLGDQPKLPPRFDQSCADIDPSECSKYMVECCLTCNTSNPVLSMSADEVCQELTRDNKFVMLRSAKSHGDALCARLQCYASTDGKQFDKKTYKAPNGMACGKNKRCSWGKCVSTKLGNPDIPDQCPFGDQDLHILGYKGTCEQYSQGKQCRRWGNTCCQSCQGKR